MSGQRPRSPHLNLAGRVPVELGRAAHGVAADEPPLPDPVRLGGSGATAPSPRMSSGTPASRSRAIPVRPSSAVILELDLRGQVRTASPRDPSVSRAGRLLVRS